MQVGPDGQPLTGEGPKSPRNKSGAKRRRNGRWSQEETDTLIALVRSSGKGKWKKILEEGGANFKNRSQVRAAPHPGLRRGVLLHILNASVATIDTVGGCGLGTCSRHFCCKQITGIPSARCPA